MENLDYQKIGLKVGLEIHGQLNTKKLFCNCDSKVRDDEPDFTVKRRIRAVAGESGEIDIAAMHEMAKEKQYIYECYEDTTCLVELDEEPPHKINKEALNVALQVSMMLNAQIIDEIFVMRKTVVDGSNTSGFQRTALIARNGFIEVNNTTLKKIGVQTICLEEDAARIIKTEKEYTVYRLDRLGIPLIEIATEPFSATPEWCKEVAAHIGMIIKSTGKAMSGIGTIRQDVNVSIKNGARVEIKGAQDLRMLSTIVEYEAMRQKKFLEIFEKLKNLKAKVENKKYDFSHLLKNSESKVIQSVLNEKGAVLGIKLKNFAGFLGMEIQPGRRFGTELSDYAKSQGVGGLFHSDELPKYGITKEEVDKIRKELNCEEKDAFIIISSDRERTERAMDAVIDRASKLEVLNEVRRANEDGTSTFLRPMPGSSRMYPETDIPAIIPNTKGIELPELIKEKIKRFEKKYGLSRDLATMIVKSGINYEECVAKYKNIKPIFIADFFVNFGKEIKARYKLEIDAENYADELFEKLNNDEIPKSAVFEILVEIAQSKKVDYKIDYSKYKTSSDEDVEKEVKNLISKHPHLNIQALMGELMKKYRGKVEGKKLMDLLKKYKKE